MKIYKNINVFDAALERIRYIFDEFPNIICGVSGGKDSTVVLNLCLKVAHEKGRLPLKVLFIDQEAEWQSTIDVIREWMYHPDVEPKWYQIPIKLFNATSTQEHWLKCWDPEKKEIWVHDKDPVSIKENVYGKERFNQLFEAIIGTEYPDTKTAYISGVRTEESPARFTGLTCSFTYKGITWGCILNKAKGHYTFYPIYDWSYTDVWKSIHDNGWRYNRIYDLQYMYGIKVMDMRVSNVHHETAVHNLFYMQEAEPETYERLVRRVKGIDMAGKMGKEDFWVRELPFMFSSWKEYRDFLLEKLFTTNEWKERFRKKFEKMDREFELFPDKDLLHRQQVQSILANDYYFTKLDNFERQPPINNFRKWRDGKKFDTRQYTKYLPKEALYGGKQRAGK